MELLKQNKLSIAIGTTAFLIAFYFLGAPWLGTSLDSIPGDLGDGRFNLFVLEHNFKWITGQVDHYWSPNIFYPTPSTFTYSDNLMGTSPLYILFRAIGWDTYASYQGWIVLLMFLNFICSFFSFKYFFKSDWIAICCALIFAFGLSLVSQITHLQMLPRFPIPLAILFFARFKDTRTIVDFFWMTFLVVYQFYCGIYLGFFLLLTISFLLFSTITLEFRQWRPFLRLSYFKALLIPLVINGALLALLMAPYIIHKNVGAGNAFDSISGTLPRLRSFLFANPASTSWAETKLATIGNDLPFFWEHWLFPGAITFVGLLVLAILGWKKHRVIWLAAGLLFTTFLFGKGMSLYELFFHLPGFESMRSLARIINVEVFFMAFGLGIALSLIKTRRILVPTAVLVFAILLIDNHFEEAKVPHFTLKEARSRQSELVKKLAKLPKGAVFSYEPEGANSQNSFVYQIDAMLAAQHSNLKCINGYSGYSPKDYTPYWNNMNEEGRLHYFKGNNIKVDNLYIIK